MDAKQINLIKVCSMLPRKFEPWKKDRLTGAKIAAGGLGVGVVSAGFAMAGVYEAAVLFGVIAFALAGAGASRLKRAANREFGKAFEVEYVERAVREMDMHGIRSKANLMVRGIGDIDLVAYPGDAPVPVEVKSFIRWNQFLIFKGEREARALAQSERQRRAIRAKRSIVWLPQGRPTLLQRLFGAGGGDVSVVFGSERSLIRAVKRLTA